MASRLVILRRTAAAFEAARAMMDNHVGSVLVVDGHHRLVGILTDRDLALAVARPDFDPRTTTLSALMTDVVGTCEPGAGEADVVCTMKQYACRRVPFTRQGRPVDLVTLDDLLAEESIAPGDAREIVAAQLGMPSRHKPAGSLRPGQVAESGALPPEERRREARRERAFRELTRAVEAHAAVGTRERAETAVRIGIGLLCRRLHPDDARWLTEGLPAWLRAEVAAEAEASAEPVTIEAIAAALHGRLELPPDAAVDVVLSISEAVTEIAASGEAGSPASRLRWSLRDLFPRAGS